MTVENILNAIETKRPDLTRQEARAVATDVFYSGEAVEDILASGTTLDKLINGYKSRQSAAAKSVTANDPKVCPVCKVPLKPIKLANDRKAVFCSKHFVVFPVPPSKEGE
jgi:hypoxanthine-guanine phosphoribosyltransferase